MKRQKKDRVFEMDKKKKKSARPIKGDANPVKAMGKRSTLFLDQTDKNENKNISSGIDFEKV